MPAVLVADVSDIEAARRLPVQRLVAALTVICVGINLPLPVGSLSLGVIAASAVAPVTVPVALRDPWMRRLFAAGVACVVTGFWLAGMPGPRLVDSSLARETLFLLTFLVLGGFAVVWARTLLPDAWVAGLYGVGLVLGISTGGQFFENPWKFGFALPVAVLVLSLTWAARTRRPDVLTLLVLSVAAALTDSRSVFGLLLISAMLLTWSTLLSRPARRTSTKQWIVSLLLVLVAFGVIYKTTETLVLDGLLGEETQQRSQLQVDTAGSLLLGGRPELGATMALMRADPWGFGIGVEPTSSDVLTAKSGMAALGYDPNNGYVEDYMFGAGVEVHSGIGDLWAAFGPAGVALALVMLALALTGLATQFTKGLARGLVVYLSVRLLWDLFFSPIYSSLSVWVLFLGMVIAVPASAAVRRPSSVP